MDCQGESRMLLGAVTDRVGSDAKRSRQNVDRMFQDLAIAISAQEVVTEAAARSEALMRENCRAGARKKHLQAVLPSFEM